MLPRVRWRDISWVGPAITLWLTIALGLMSPPTVFAGHNSVVRHGTCTGRSQWKLAVHKVEGGNLHVRLDVEDGRAGQKWHVFLSDNGTGFYAGSRISGSGGRFHVSERTANARRTDRIRAAANNVTTGEICAGRAAL